jgi:DNA repair exonuclease SbcCD nuclease subunit
LNKNTNVENFSTEFDISVFLRIGQSLCDNNDCVYKDNNLFFLKLDENIKSFENEKVSILNKIEILSLSNKKISDTLKKYESELNESDLNNKFSIFLNFKREKIKKIIERDTKIYNETFEKITNMYEQIIKIEENIKKTKSF